jgi:hypothetical protein
MFQIESRKGDRMMKLKMTVVCKKIGTEENLEWNVLSLPRHIHGYFSICQPLSTFIIIIIIQTLLMFPFQHAIVKNCL